MPRRGPCHNLLTYQKLSVTSKSASGVPRRMVLDPLRSYNRWGMDLAYQLLAAKYIRRQIRQLAAQSLAVRAATDIEAVHRARVASRRLRAALRVFSDVFHGKEIDRWRKSIRRITSALGDARDRDVQIELLCGKLSELKTPECFPGLARILVDLERDREQFQRRVIKAVDRLERSRILDEMQRVARRIIKKADTDSASAAREAALSQVEGHLTKHLAELLALEDSLNDPTAADRHHAMRIAAKRLRYTLELSQPLCPSQFTFAVKALKKLQTLLGEVHDCDVWVEHLHDFADGEQRRLAKLFGHGGRFDHLQPGIAYLEQDRLAYRQATFHELTRYWGELRQQGFFEQLGSSLRGDQAVTAPAGSSSEAPTPEPGDAAAPDAQVEGPATTATSPSLSDGETPPRKPLLTTGF